MRTPLLWRVRATLPDRPGALAQLARECGDAGVNILGLQLFPGVARVTDELVVSVPADWSEVDLTSLLERAGAQSVVSAPCTEAALVDQPTRYVRAAREILAHPESFPEVVAHLFDADADADERADQGADVMDLLVGDVAVQVRRAAPFTATEHARAAALAELVGDVLGRQERQDRRVGGRGDARRMGTGSSPTYATGPDGVVARIDDLEVGCARVGAATAEEPLTRRVHLEVDPAWHRRGIGTRLLGDAARVARGAGAQEIVLTTRADNRAVLPMVLAAGLRGRIRMAGEELSVRIGLADVRPPSGRPTCLVD